MFRAGLTAMRRGARYSALAAADPRITEVGTVDGARLVDVKIANVASREGFETLSRKLPLDENGWRVVEAALLDAATVVFETPRRSGLGRGEGIPCRGEVLGL